MKQTKTFALAVATLLAGMASFTACSSDKDDLNPNVIIDENGTANVKPEFVISIPHSVVKTRMAGAATQADGSVAQFRGLSNIQLIPFNTEPQNTTTKFANVINLEDIAPYGMSGSLKSVGNVNYRVYADAVVPVNTSHFLMYAKATDNTNDKFAYGSLVVSNLGDDFTTPGDVQIGLEQINSSKTAIKDDATGQAILTALTNIANTEGWDVATNTLLQGLRTQFLGLQVCASDYIAVVLNSLYFSAAHVDYADEDDPAYIVSRRICTAIEAIGTPKSGDKLALQEQYKGFPANLNLPDGAANIEWDGTAFVDKTADPDAPFQSNLTQYAYPAAIWYYVSTRIKASDDIESPKYSETATNAGGQGPDNDDVAEWSQVIETVYDGASDKVTENTQSVALVKPAQYGVGRLELRLRIAADSDGKVYDHAGNEMDVTKGFTLTGVLVGGQTIANYDFSTSGLAYGANTRTIYDRNVPDGIVAKVGDYTTVKNHTLGLETVTDTPVNIALELVNNGPAFQAKGGVITTGSKFYLKATLNPVGAGGYAAGSVDKVFMPDYVTKVNITIKSGKDGDGGPGESSPAVPDLSTETIELGTSVDLEWVPGLTIEPEI